MTLNYRRTTKVCLNALKGLWYVCMMVVARDYVKWVLLTPKNLVASFFSTGFWVYAKTTTMGLVLGWTAQLVVVVFLLWLANELTD